MDLRQFALDMLQRNPQIGQNPNSQAMIQALQSGNNAQGEQLANNILQSYGMSKEDGIKMARRFFGI